MGVSRDKNNRQNKIHSNERVGDELQPQRAGSRWCGHGLLVVEVKATRPDEAIPYIRLM